MRRLLARTAVLAALLGCEGLTAPAPGPDPLPPPNSSLLDGSWRAIYWIAEPQDAPVLDVYELGGRLTLSITNGYVSGTMDLPEGVTSGIPLQADMAGVVLVDGDKARFIQGTDTFVGRATWRIGEDALFIVDHQVETTRFTVVLVRGW